MQVTTRTIRAALVFATVPALLTALGTAAGATPRTAAARTAATTAVASPWSQTDYNAAQSRANLTEQTLTRATVAQVGYLRGMAAPIGPSGGGQCDELPFGSPVLTGGAVYAMAGEWLTKYDEATGHVIWTVNPDPASNTGYGSLAVAGGLVVVGELSCDSESDPNGSMQAFSAATGALAWTRPISPDGGALLQMVVSGGLVVASGTSAGSGNVVSVHRLATGALVWSRGSGACDSDALVVAKLVISYRCRQDGASSVFARTFTGSKVWSLHGGWRLQRGDTDAAGGHHLYVTSPTGTVVSLDPLTGAAQYSLAGASHVLAVDNTRVYAVCARGAAVCAYNSTSGNKRWQAATAATVKLAAEAGGVLYLDQGQALNTGTGQTIATLWQFLTTTSLAVGDGRIAAVTDPRVLDLYGLPGS
jgi:outer membrane protein assembly factor BamB